MLAWRRKVDLMDLMYDHTLIVLVIDAPPRAVSRRGALRLCDSTASGGAAPAPGGRGVAPALARAGSLTTLVSDDLGTALHQPEGRGGHLENVSGRLHPGHTAPKTHALRFDTSCAPRG